MTNLPEETPERALLMKELNIAHDPGCSGGESCSCGLLHGTELILAVRRNPLIDLLTRASLTQMDPEEYE